MLWICETKIWWKSIIVWYGYKHIKHCFIVYIKAGDIYKDTAEDIEIRFDTNYKLDRKLPKRKNEKVIGLMKDESGEKILTKFVGVRAKTYSSLTKDDSEDKKKQKSQKSVS